MAWSFMVACVLHAATLFGMRLGLMHPAEFGMETGRNSIEVNLVAAPPENPPEPAPFQTTLPPPEPPQEDDFVIPEPMKPPHPVPPIANPARPSPPRHAQTLAAPSTQASFRPGSDSTTIQAEGGARHESKPGYLKNPPPRYPEKARQLGQEGALLLSVKVNIEGKPESVEIKQSSGFALLDAAAVKAVEHWVFRPASIGAVPVPCEVDIPIRFQIH